MIPPEMEEAVGTLAATFAANPALAEAIAGRWRTGDRTSDGVPADVRAAAQRLDDALTTLAATADGAAARGGHPPGERGGHPGGRRAARGRPRLRSPRR